MDDSFVLVHWERHNPETGRFVSASALHCARRQDDGLTLCGKEIPAPIPEVLDVEWGTSLHRNADRVCSKCAQAKQFRNLDKPGQHRCEANVGRPDEPTYLLTRCKHKATSFISRGAHGGSWVCTRHRNPRSLGRWVGETDERDERWR
jgi:hypothetical protein